VTGLVCLQGGGEFSAGCLPMDAAVLRGATGRAPARVVVTALASAPGRDARTAEQNGVAHYRRVGADPVAAPDARDDPEGALRALSAADLVVLPGGSPGRLLEALQQTPVGVWLVEAVRGGKAVSGASAGAMVLGSWTVLPDRAGPDVLDVVPGLGLVDVVVVPHWSGRHGRADWLGAVAAAAPPDVEVLGLPEESGVIVSDESVTGVGVKPVRLVHASRELPAGESWTLRPQGPRTAS
jgi:cyanophycinase-like exopeptidase